MMSLQRMHRAAPWAASIAALLISTGLIVAQTPAPPPAPAPAPGAPAPAAAAAPVQPAATTAPKPTCDSPIPTSARAVANIAVAAGESLRHKNWQPVGGVIEYTINSVEPMDADAEVITCFRWKTLPPQGGLFAIATPSRLELTNLGKTLKVTVTVPPLPDVDTTVDRSIWVVPLAQVRTLVFNKGKAGTLDVWSVIGITHPTLALALAFAVVLLSLIALNLAVNARITHEGTKKANWFLRIISTPSATASLSQFQIVMWTFVVLASAVYVALLSGQLIEITTGTLILLGISGAATLGTQAHNASELAAKANAADAAAKENAAASSADAATKAAAQAKVEAAKKDLDAATKPKVDKQPSWTDLIINEGPDERREIDVTRVQVLLFTIITAAFVLITVIATYVIPEIPQGFLILMGISNGVYIGSKVVQKT